MRFQPRSLQQRTLFYILVPTFVLLVIMSTVGFVFVRDLLLNQWGETAIAALQRTAHQIDMQLREPKDMLLLLEDNDDAEATRVIFASIRKRLEGLKGVVGVEIVWPGEKGVEAPPSAPRPSMEMEGMHRHSRFDHISITAPQYNKNLKNRTVSLVSELKNSIEATVGRIAVVISFDELINEIINAPWWMGNKAYLIDDSGNVLASTARQSELEDQFPQRAFGTLTQLEAQTMTAMRSRGFGTVFGPGRPPEEVSGYYRLSEAPWTMVVMARGEQVLQPIIRFKSFYVLSFALCILLILVFIRMTTSRLTARIKEISAAADDLAGGRFGAPLAVTSPDEVGELAASFNKMTRQLRQRLRMKEAINVAREVQQNLLPKAGFQAAGVEAAGQSLYCDETGGDYFDIIEFPENDRKVGVAVGDVVGHGIGAALLMTTVRALLRCRLAQPGRLDRMMADVNRLLCRDTRVSGSFITLFYLEVDRLRHTLRWVRAGHEPALVYSPGTGSFSELKGQGVALGVDGNLDFLSHELQLAKEPRLIWIGSDGAWEVENGAGEQFGRERIKQLLAANWTLPAELIIKTVIEEITAFRGNTPQHDDITLAVVKTW
jgi:sigma-B regulation protein RsbU (phosphoserine phosphatase)